MLPFHLSRKGISRPIACNLSLRKDPANTPPCRSMTEPRMSRLDQPSLLSPKRPARSTMPMSRRSSKSLRRRSQNLKHPRAPKHLNRRSLKSQRRRKHLHQRRRSQSLRLLNQRAAAVLKHAMSSLPVLSQREWRLTEVSPSAKSREPDPMDASSKLISRTTSLLLAALLVRLDLALHHHQHSSHLDHHPPRT